MFDGERSTRGANVPERNDASVGSSRSYWGIALVALGQYSDAFVSAVTVLGVGIVLKGPMSYVS